MICWNTYKATIDACFGEGSCHVLNIRNYGAVPVTVVHVIIVFCLYTALPGTPPGALSPGKV